MTALLQVQGIGKRFGGLVALADVSFEVPEGAIVGVMGANGAGKTTLFSLIAGNARPTTGDIRFAGQSIVGLRPDQVCRLGVARTFQIVKPFAGDDGAREPAHGGDVRARAAPYSRAPPMQQRSLCWRRWGWPPLRTSRPPP